MDTVLSDSLISTKEFTLSHNERILRSLYQLRENHDKNLDELAYDDVIIPGKLVLCVNQEYEFNMRSMDVIHSAYFPHFRAQMNAVPGMTTRMNFTPNITTKEMRKIKNDPKFNYILLCNKICGKSHYKMKMDVEVLSEEEYAIWWASQKTAETFQMKYSSSDSDTMENDEDKEVQSENSNDDSNEDSATSEVVINENN